MHTTRTDVQNLEYHNNQKTETCQNEGTFIETKKQNEVTKYFVLNAGHILKEIF